MTAGTRVVYAAPRYMQPLLLVRGDEVALPEGGEAIGRWVRYVCARPCAAAGHSATCAELVLHGAAAVHADGASLLWCRTPRTVI